MLKIFYGRAYVDYNSQFESDNIKLIKDKFGGEIIKLPDLEDGGERFGKALYLKEKEHFFPLIDKCDIFVCCPIDNEFNKDGSRRSDKGKLSNGVKIEALYALSIRKKVYKIDGKEFKEIKGISDSEELIYEVVRLDNDKLLDEYPKIKALMESEKRLPQNIHPKIMSLYLNNEKVRNLMKGFLSGGRNDIEYTRTIVFQKKYPVLKDPIHYLPRGGEYTLRIK